MYDIKLLEDQWEKYNKKKRRPWYLVGIIILLLSLLSYTVLKYNLVERFISEDNNQRVIKNIARETPTIVAPTKILIEPELNVSKEIVHTDTVELKVETLIPLDNNPMDTVEENVLPSPVEKIKKPQVKQKDKVIEKPRKKMHLNIIETTSLSAYKEVEKRFHKSQDIDDSLFLAGSYYAKGKYKKAEYWALETNKINRNIEDSWLIFAKAKMKLGHRNEAVRILTSYIKRSNSKNAKDLLLKIRNGDL